jgi:arylsulfatase
MNSKFMTFGIACLFIGSLHAQEVDRTELPIKPPFQKHVTVEDVRDVENPKPFMLAPPKGAPNVVMILLDDNGFATNDTYGGPIETPVLTQLAKEGMMYNMFHTTALCSPTRQALLTGRNHHTANQAGIAETATSFRGDTGQLPSSVAPLAKILKYNGYNTAAFGKWHQTAVWETSISGPFDRWPNGQGFEEFYGFLGGETNQWDPSIHHNMNKVELDTDDGYHFMKDMTDKAIEYIRYQKAVTPNKPYFVYFAPGAVHAPHHVPKEYIEREKGRFDEGWDVIRERSFKRQKEMGLIPQNTKLPPKPQDIKDWKSLSDEEQKLFARQAEVFSAFLKMTDYEIGRFLDVVEELDENTLVIYIIGDNGTSAEGGMNGLYNEYTYFNNVTDASTVDFMMDYYDAWGDETTYPHMAAGWAVAFDSPFAWTKQEAGDYGGTRNGMIIKWPGHMKDEHKLRQQWHHVIDIAPTILEVTGIPEPDIVDGIPQIPMAGKSMAYTFENPDADTHRMIQYFEIYGNRGLYYDGWFARVVHNTPWNSGRPIPNFKDDVWNLYHVDEDFSMAKDLALKYPERLEDMKELFAQEAIKYDVYPLDDRTFERFNAGLVGRPSLMEGRTVMTLYEGMSNLKENNFLNIKNTSFKIEAELNLTKNEEKTNGVIISQAGRFGGWSFYTLEDKLYFTYNFVGIDYYTAESSVELPKNGKVNVQVVFDYDGGGLGKGGDLELFIDGKSVGKGRVDRTEFTAFSADESVNVGFDSETSVVPDAYDKHSSHFTQGINYVTTTLMKPDKK